MDLNFITEEGNVCKHEIIVYALSTCGFCKRAMRFLKEHSIKFKYIYFDELEPELKSKIENTLTLQFKDSLAFPFVVIDCNRCLIGFDKEKWEKEFL